MIEFSDANHTELTEHVEVKYVIQTLITEDDAVWGHKEPGVWQACADVPPWLQYSDQAAWEHYLSWTAQFPGRKFRLHRTEFITRYEAYS